VINLQNIFVGFVKSYRTFRLRYDPLYESMSRWTGAEIARFAELGEDLGFAAVVEKQVFARRNPVDLAWVDPFTGEVVLHLERENVPAKIGETIHRKLLPRTGAVARFTVAIFDELRQEAFADIQNQAVRAFKGKKGCAELLAICYGDIPSRHEARRRRVPRYWMEWPVCGLHLVRGELPHRLEAKCTTDRNYMYTMYMVDPAYPEPREDRRWGTKPART
jgi:hypothetical protein